MRSSTAEMSRREVGISRMSRTNASRDLTFALDFRFRCSISRERENHQRAGRWVKKVSRDGSAQASISPAPPETPYPLRAAKLQSIPGIPDRIVHLRFFGPGMLCHDFIKVPEGHVSNAVDRISPPPKGNGRRAKNHPSVANIHPWYFVGKFPELRIKLQRSRDKQQDIRISRGT